MFIQAVKYGLSSVQYGVRKRLPLYADDRSKIFDRHARSILKLSIVPLLPKYFRFKLWDRFSDNFTMPDSINLFYDAVSPVAGIREDFEQWVSLEDKSEFLEQMMLRQRYDAEAKVLTFAELCNLRNHAVLISSGEHIDEISAGILKDVKSLQIWHAHPQQIERVEKSLPDSAETAQQRDYKCLSETYAGNYSQGQIEASDKADRIGDAIAQTLCEDAYFSQSFSAKVKPEIALLVSDLVYRLVQNFVCIRAALADIDKQKPLILTPQNLDFAPEADSRGFSVVIKDKMFDPFSHTLSKVTSSKEDGHHENDSAPFYKDEWDRHISKLDERLTRSLANAETTSEKDRVYIFCNRRSHSYDGAVTLIEAALKDKFAFLPINTGLPDGLTGNILSATRRDLFSVIQNSSIRRMPNMTPTVQDLVSAAFESIHEFDDFEREALKSRVETVIMTVFGSLMAHGRLYQALYEIAETLPKSSQAILIPGRDPTVRVMSRAFQAAGLKTTDVQVLFVSDMPRYKSPTADKLAVIDKHSGRHFCKKYGYKDEDIGLIGSINVEAEVANAAVGLPFEIYPKVFAGPKAPVFTYGMQPLPIEDLERALEWCAKTLEALPNSRLIVKLHPAQAEGVVPFAQDIVRKYAGNDARGRWKVIRDQPFHEVVAITDVLLTHYSNVAMTAAAMGKAVGTLPVSGVRPSPTLADMEMSTDINSARDLTAFVKTNIGSFKVGETQYLKENPHIKDGRSLTVLGAMLTENVEQSSKASITQ